MDDNQNQQDPQDEVQDAVIVDEEDQVQSPSSTPTTVDGSEVLLSLENLIKGNISRIEKLGQELRQHKQMVDDTFTNDPTYREHLEQAKETLRVKNNTRNEILKQPSVIQLQNKVKSMSAELKELRDGLSDYLMEYQRMSGANEIEGENGEVWEIVQTAKPVKRSSSKPR